MTGRPPVPRDRRGEPAPAPQSPEERNHESPEAEEPRGEALVFSRAAVREVDRLATQEFGLPSIVLMENAAIHCADVALDLLEEQEEQRALVVCGPGNNGGDGLAVARHLSNQGVHCAIVLSAARDAYTGDGATNLRVAEKMGIEVTAVDPPDAAASVRAVLRRQGPPSLVIDALLGTGLDRPVREPLTSLIGAINELGKAGTPVLAVDLPSGLDCDSGEPLGAAVRATVTVTFVGLKQGFLALEAQPYVGDVVVADIGVPRALVERLGRPLRDALPHDETPRRPARPAPRARTGG